MFTTVRLDQSLLVRMGLIEFKILGVIVGIYTINLIASKYHKIGPYNLKNSAF